MVTIWITRPQAAAEKLAQVLKRHGFDSVIEPLLTIEASSSPLPDRGEIQAVMITSANALDALASSEQDVTTLFSLPCFCVGLRTAEKAQAFGFTNIHASNGDGVDLARLVAQKHKGKSLLHIAGQDTGRKAQMELERLGFEVIFWPVYMARAASALTEKTVQLLHQQKLGAVVAFSVRTAEVLTSLLRQQELEACCASLSAIGLSPAVSDALRVMGWREVHAASEPTEDAVIECLKRLYSAA